MPTTNQKECVHKDCNFAKVVLLLGDVWNILIVHALIESSEVRFGEFLERITGLSNSVLSSRLKNLLELGVIKRESIVAMPPQVIYSLTPTGAKLVPIFEQLKDFEF